ncbi:MAG: glycosyltransferase family 2 protein [Candidatus Omnitrophica bacterium]|nr:glycosyltransferase family 2 protein [Candidatus Omnitrophota bacterium]
MSENKEGQKKVPVSVVVITKNEERNIEDCLTSVTWADEIIVLDDCSTDRTVEIAHKFTDRVSERKMDVEGTHRNYAYSLASNEWVFSLDADERVTPELASEITQLLSNLEEAREYYGYTVPRRNYIGKRWLKYGGWYPSAQLKLFRRDEFKYEEVEVHPRAFMDGPCGHLKGDLIHYSYRDLANFLSKLNKQTDWEAAKWVKDNRKVGLLKSLRKTVDRFIKSYIIKRGYKDGFLGFMAAYFNSLYQLISYAKYREKKEEKE